MSVMIGNRRVLAPIADNRQDSELHRTEKWRTPVLHHFELTPKVESHNMMHIT